MERNQGSPRKIKSYPAPEVTRAERRNEMTKTMPYWLYKTGYEMFPAGSYNKTNKTIEVELPEYKKPRFPKGWRKVGNGYSTPNGFGVYRWGSGLAENFRVERRSGFDPYTMRCSEVIEKTFPPSLYVREQVMDFIESFE